MRYLLDTNIIAEPSKLQPNPSLTARINQYSDQIAISAVSWHELWYGTNLLPTSRKRQLLESYLNRLLRHPSFQFCPIPKKPRNGSPQSDRGWRKSGGLLPMLMDKLQRSQQ